MTVSIAGHLRNLYPTNNAVTLSHLIATLLLGLIVAMAARGRLGLEAFGMVAMANTTAPWDVDRLSTGLTKLVERST